MKIYWDLTEKKRSALTAEQVEQFIDAELMTMGVLKVQPLVLEPVPVAPKPDKVYYRLRWGKYEDSDMVFDTAEHAQAVAGLVPKRVSHSYAGHEARDVAVDGEKIEVVSVEMFTQESFNSAREMLRKADAILADNEKRRKEYDEAVRKQAHVLQRMWDDWNECRASAARLRRVIDTFNDYLSIAGGDGVVAARFLAKVFTRDDIADASIWFGMTIPIPDDAPGLKQEPMTAGKPQDDTATF